VNVYLAGGMAAHLYTADQVTTDVDAEFGERLPLPDDLSVNVMPADGKLRLPCLDKNYNSTFALMHEDSLRDAVPVDLGLEHLRVYVLSPADLAASKIARPQDHDQDDIRSLARHGLATFGEIKRRADEAAAAFAGAPKYCIGI
jgi:hypothetical protein